MNGNVYMLRTGVNHLSPDIIYSRDTALKIKVYNLTEVNFRADESEIQLYGWYNHDLLAFETIDILPEDAMDMIMAIRWYAHYLGYMDMEILPEDPRHKHGHEIAV